MNTDDELKLNELREGHPEAFKFFFKKYYKLLVMQAFYILDDEMEAEDQVQALFADIWEKQLYRFINSSFKAYLQTAIRNKCFKAIDKKKTVQKHLDQFTIEAETTTEEDLDLVLNQADESRVMDLFKQLPQQRMEAFNLVYLQDKKYRDAASEMGISINSIKTHLKLAVKELRLRLNNLK